MLLCRKTRHRERRDCTACWVHVDRGERRKFRASHARGRIDRVVRRFDQPVGVPNRALLVESSSTMIGASILGLWNRRSARRVRRLETEVSVKVNRSTWASASSDALLVHAKPASSLYTNSLMLMNRTGIRALATCDVAAVLDALANRGVCAVPRSRAQVRSLQCRLCHRRTVVGLLRRRQRGADRVKSLSSSKAVASH
jgi:hypothetical protein